MSKMANKPAYDLRIVREKINTGNYRIRQNALSEAYATLGFDEEDIKSGILKLKKSDCYKSDPHFKCPSIFVDFYRSFNQHRAKDIYTHFYITDAGYLIINSFKRI